MKKMSPKINQNKVIQSLAILLFVLVSVFVPKTIFAASISASSDSSINAGDTSIISVFLNTEDEVINSVDGTISLIDSNKGNFEVKDLSIANSVFSMWPRSPSLEEGGKISFVGGVPGGVKGDHLLMFRIIVKINQSGNFSVSLTSVTSYLNDGLGTSKAVVGQVSSISVGAANTTPKDRWQEIVSNDNVAPEPFDVTINQDSNLFDGKKFVSFETTDGQSGINYYEVREGNYPSVRTGTTYVLNDQDGPVNLTVTAYDKAGNFQISTINGKKSTNWKIITMVIFVLLLAYVVYRKMRKNKSKNVQNKI